MVLPTESDVVQDGSPLDGVKVISIGVLDFAEALWAQGVPCVHVDWSPPSREEAELNDLLARLL